MAPLRACAAAFDLSKRIGTIRSRGFTSVQTIRSESNGISVHWAFAGQMDRLPTMLSFDFMVPPETALERVLQEKYARKEGMHKCIIGRVAVENLAPNHVYRWLVDWMNQQLSDIGVNSTGGRLLPPIHFDLVQVLTDIKNAHVLEADGLAFIVVTQPMVDEMLRLSHSLAERNQGFMRLQIAPAANSHEIAQLILFMQFCLVTAHEYSHLVRGHWDDAQPPETGESLSQAQELDADGYGIYHDLAYFFQGRGRLLTSQWLRISYDKKRKR